MSCRFIQHYSPPSGEELVSCVNTARNFHQKIICVFLEIVENTGKLDKNMDSTVKFTDKTGNRKIANQTLNSVV